jgi:hypothetical protein
MRHGGRSTAGGGCTLAPLTTLLQLELELVVTRWCDRGNILKDHLRGRGGALSERFRFACLFRGMIARTPTAQRSMASCPAVPYRPSCWVMFSVDETTAAAIRKAFEERGELSAVVELRRHFPGLKDNENARACVRAIAGWKPLPPLPKRSRKWRTRLSTP